MQDLCGAVGGVVCRHVSQSGTVSGGGSIHTLYLSESGAFTVLLQ